MYTRRTRKYQVPKREPKEHAIPESDRGAEQVPVGKLLAAPNASNLLAGFGAPKLPMSLEGLPLGVQEACVRATGRGRA